MNSGNYYLVTPVAVNAVHSDLITIIILLVAILAAITVAASIIIRRLP